MKKNKRLIIIPIILIIVLIIIGISFANRKEKPKSTYKWEISKKEGLSNGVYKSELKDIDEKNRCLENVCVDNVVILFNKDSGKISYDLTNNGKKKLRKAYYYLKLSTDEKMLVYVKKLKPGETFHGEIYFSGKNMYNVTGYKLVNLTKKELKNVK